MVATNKGTLAAAGNADPANWIMGTVVPLLREHFAANGQPTSPDRNVYTMRVAMVDLLVKDLGLKGSGQRVFAILVHPAVRILVKLDNGGRGKAAYPPLWSVNMSAHPTRATIREAMTGIADEATQRRREQRRKQETRYNRLAGEYPVQTTGGPVTTTHVPPKHVHARDIANHAHEGKTALHHHEPDGSVVWVEYRTPGRTAPAATDPTAALSTTSAVQEVTTDLAGGRAAMLIRPNSDRRYQGLVEIIGDLEAKLRSADSREEDYLAQIKEMQERLLALEDPSAMEADKLLKQYGKA